MLTTVFWTAVLSDTYYSDADHCIFSHFFSIFWNAPNRILPVFWRLLPLLAKGEPSSFVSGGGAFLFCFIVSERERECERGWGVGSHLVLLHSVRERECERGWGVGSRLVLLHSVREREWRGGGGGGVVSLLVLLHSVRERESERGLGAF